MERPLTLTLSLQGEGITWPKQGVGMIKLAGRL
jgi:hypothetical protein